MKSIKPGRGPSRAGMVMSIAVAVFGVFWLLFAIALHFWIMLPFGLIFIGIAVYNAIYNGKNAAQPNRFSLIDIVDEEEEPDPLNERYRGPEGYAPPRSDVNVNEEQAGGSRSGGFCPYCGAPAAKDYEFCRQCGKKLPD